MKRRRHNSGQTKSWAARRGSLFHYYMVYMLLSSVLMITAGLCLHAILKADRLGTQSYGHLAALLRLEERLRTDVAACADVKFEPQTLTVLDTSGADVNWVVDRNIIRRETKNEAGLTSSDRFVFRKGTSLSFRREVSEACGVLSVRDPEPLSAVMPRESGSATEAQSDVPPQKRVEILFALPGDNTSLQRNSTGGG